MFYRVQIWIAIIICVMLISIINMVRREKIDLRYALSWILLALIALILDIFPQILWWMAYIVGIEYGFYCCNSFFGNKGIHSYGFS